MFVERMFMIARQWSNQELRRLAPLFSGDVVNVSAWDDRDKEGSCYRNYFANASGYSYTNYPGTMGYQGRPNEFELDLTKELPKELAARFDVAFNHTTLEHVFDVRTAFGNLCAMSKDVVIVVVPFAQVQHETDSWQDFWRFTPSCLRRMYEENGLETIYESQTPYKKAAIYLLSIGSRNAEKWRSRMPAHEPVRVAGTWIGQSLAGKVYRNVMRRVFGIEDASYKYKS